MAIKFGSQVYGMCREVLEDDRAYSPTSISQKVFEANLFPELVCLEDIRLQKQMIRISLVRIAFLNEFPKEGDATVPVLHTMTEPGWFGSRWKQALQ